MVASKEWTANSVSALKKRVARGKNISVGIAASKRRQELEETSRRSHREVGIEYADEPV